jgi:hypothetical protein
MATSNVSAIDNDVWQLIATNTPSTASTSTFSSISGYKKLMLTFKNYTTSVSGPVQVRFNSDSTIGNTVSYANWYSNGGNYSETSIILGVYAYTSTVRHGYIVVDNVNQSAPHIVDGQAYDGYIRGAYLPADPITSIVISPQNGGTFSGTFLLYGIAG